MTVRSVEEMRALAAAGRIVRAALDEMERFVRAGVTTAEINRVGAAAIRRLGGRSAPVMVYDFPAEVCISVNEEIVHGIPSGRIVKEGDLVKLDVTVEKDGYMADAATTVVVGEVSEWKMDLVACARRALASGMRAARAGNRVRDIGRAVEAEVARAGFSVVRELTGHGIGRTIHEKPYIYNYYDRRHCELLTEGMVITIEPLITMGSGRARGERDGWTISSADGSAAAHVEETIVITKGLPIVLTAAA